MFLFKREEKNWQPCSECIVPIVVGIGGATRSGKTSLSRNLRTYYSNIIERDLYTLCQDRFFDVQQMLVVDGFRNSESPEAVDMDRFIETIKILKSESTIPCQNCIKKKKQSKDFNNTPFVPTGEKKQSNIKNIMIVEGFLLYCDERIYSLFDIKLFVHITHDTCLKRRMSTTRVPQEYFDKLIWPCYLQYNEIVLNKKISNIFILDGEQEKEDAFSNALKIIENSVVH